MLQSDFCREAATNDIPGLGKVALEGSRFYALEHLARRPEEITPETPENIASRRLPGMTQRNVLPIASFRAGDATTQELPHLETFPGAARCKPIELQCHKAAPLQASVLSTRRGFISLPYQPLVRLSIIHVANDVIVLHLDSVNFVRITLNDPFASHISDNPQD